MLPSVLVCREGIVETIPLRSGWVGVGNLADGKRVHDFRAGQTITRITERVCDGPYLLCGKDALRGHASPSTTISLINIMCRRSHVQAGPCRITLQYESRAKVPMKSSAAPRSTTDAWRRFDLAAPACGAVVRTCGAAPLLEAARHKM